MIGNGRACLRFRIGSAGFELPLESVEEIAAVETICPVPLAPTAVKGVATWRGRVVTLLDLATLLGAASPARAANADRLALILMKPFEHLGLYLEGPVELSHEAVARAALRAEMFGEGSLAIRPGTGGDVPTEDRPTLISVPELVAGCERAVLQQFRRRTAP